MLTLAFHASLHNSCRATVSGHKALCRWTEPEGLNATSNKLPTSASDWITFFFNIHLSHSPILSPTLLYRESVLPFYSIFLNFLTYWISKLYPPANPSIPLPPLFLTWTSPNYSVPYRSGRRGRLVFSWAYQNANAFERKHKSCWAKGGWKKVHY